MSYTPPLGSNVVLNWTVTPYTPPNGSAVTLEFETQQLLLPTGFASAVIGTATIELAGDFLYPSGWESSVVGTPAFGLAAYSILVGGIAPPPQTGPNSSRQVPDPSVTYRTRYLTATGVAAVTFPTTHAITHFTQFVDQAGRGLFAWVAGTARVEFAVRYIKPPFVVSNVFGTANVARILLIAPSGWESSFVSSNHELDINLQRVLHTTGEADPAEYGATQIRNQFEFVRPSSWASAAINFPIIYNLRRYLLVQPYMGTNSDPTQWPTYAPYVENRNRIVGPSGWRSSRFSVIGNLIDNKAVPLYPAGFDATVWGPETFIAYRIRNVQPQTWVEFYSSQYTVLYNDAAVLAARSWQSANVGVPTQVLNLNRTVQHNFPYAGEAFGTAFVAYRVRTLAPSVFLDVPAGIPEVRFNPYPIAPNGIPTPQFGGHTVYEHFTVIYPRSTNVFPAPRVGEPVLANRNREVRVSPSEQSLYGMPRVFNYDTHVTITAGDLSVWGAHLVSYRTRTVSVAPISVPAFTVLHRIRNVLPDPPTRQVVEPQSTYIGLSSNPGIVPTPTIRFPTIYPLGIYEGGYGSLVVSRNEIAPVWPTFFTLFGTPALIYTQAIAPQAIPRSPLPGEPDRGDSDFFTTKPQVSPHTIYAPAGDQATLQAIANNGGVGDPIDRTVIKGFGTASVSLYLRTIGPVPNHAFGGLNVTEVFGSARFTLSRQYVRPVGVSAPKMPPPVFLDVPQYVDLNRFNDGIAPTYDFGSHRVAPPPVITTPTVYPNGLDATRWGTLRIELFNRTITLSGIPHRGNPEQNLTNPWGTPLVGFPRIYTWGGYVLTEWGTAWVSHKNRSFAMQGWNSLSLEDVDLTAFADRMRVRRRNPPVGLLGIASTAIVSVPSVTHAIRTIRGRGVYGFVSGIPTVDSTFTISPLGWDSLVVGDIDEWEAGKVKPYGDDLSIVGTPRMRRVVTVADMADGSVSTPRLAVPIYISGMPEIGFAGPNVSNPSGCSTRVVVPLPILSQQSVSQPVVTS